MKIKILLISLSVLLVIPNFIDRDINGEPVYNQKEKFRPDLSSINSINKLEKLVDACAALKHINTHSEMYATLLSYIVSLRFYHGFSHFTLKENWIAATGEKLFGYGLASKVTPEEIIAHPYAACSQQAIIMMEILKRKHIDYRQVGFPHHSALEARINDHWYFFDPNMEPAITVQQRMHEQWKGNSDNLKQFYDRNIYHHLNFQFGHNVLAETDTVNEEPAKRAKLFQSCTGFLSKIIWCFPLLFIFSKKRRPAMYAVRPVNHFPKRQHLHPVFSA